ncbi:MAG: 6,7-dimethyl-8-ribityllumazine synthase [Gammaproteobacteria bacterium WSBS_2016_MAG_OTU1]
MNSLRIAVVVADFYDDIADALLASCNEELQKHNITPQVERVGGALEIPFALQTLAKCANKPAAMVALGCVIRGETYHFEIVSNICAQGILQVQLQTNIPIGNGVLTVEDMVQAKARIDKGAQAAQAALSLATMSANIGDGNDLSME